jgi:hypothetical protein
LTRPTDDFGRENPKNSVRFHGSKKQSGRLIVGTGKRKTIICTLRFVLQVDGVSTDPYQNEVI